jgi:hypothetical protein
MTGVVLAASAMCFIKLSRGARRRRAVVPGAGAPAGTLVAVLTEYGTGVMVHTRQLVHTKIVSEEQR